MKSTTKTFAVPAGTTVRLDKWPTRVKPLYRSEKHYKQLLAADVHELSALQNLLYASNTWSLLLIFQAMDAAGKDGAIKHVMSGVNPQGCEVFSFKHPSAEELEHDFLWRTTRCLPERGRIGIFNRSYYEEVLVVRVHPEILRGAGAAARSEPTDKPSGSERYRSIVGPGAASAPQRHAHRQVLPAPVQGGAAPALPRSASTSRRRTGNSAPPTSRSADSGSDYMRPTRTAWAPPARRPRPGMWCPPTTNSMPG